MPISKIKDKIDRLKATRAEPPTVDERDELIAKLNDQLTDEREAVLELRREIDELRFRNETLETSYAKQLDDARASQAEAEAALAELQGELDEVGNGEDILAQLATAKADLQTVTAERDRLRNRLRQPEKREPDRGPLPTDAGAEIDAYSIDELLEDAVWAQEQARLDKQKAREAAQAAALEETTTEELVSPDLVFPAPAADSSG